MTYYSGQLIILHCTLEDKDMNRFYFYHFSRFEERERELTLRNCLLNDDKNMKSMVQIIIFLLCAIEILPIIIQNILNVSHQKST